MSVRTGAKKPIYEVQFFVKKKQKSKSHRLLDDKFTDSKSLDMLINLMRHGHALLVHVHPLAHLLLLNLHLPTLSTCRRILLLCAYPLCASIHHVKA